MLTKSKSIVSNKSQIKEAPDFFKKLKEGFVNSLMEMGYDYAEVEDYLEEKGLCEMRHELLVETLKKPNFRNPLFVPELGEENPPNNPYDYNLYQPGVVK